MSDDTKINIDLSPVKLPEKSLEELTLPASTIIGQVVGAALNRVFGRARKYYLATEFEIKQTQKNLEEKLNKTPVQNRTLENIALSFKTIDDLEYKIYKAEIHELFENLITSTIDKEKSLLLHPRYSSILKEIDTSEALLLKYLDTQILKRVTVIMPYKRENVFGSDDIFYFYNNHKEGQNFWLDYSESTFNDLESSLPKLNTCSLDFSISILIGLGVIQEYYRRSSEDKPSTWDHLTKQEDYRLNELIKSSLNQKNEISQF